MINTKLINRKSSRSANRLKGFVGEILCEAYLKRRGYQILKRNLYSRYGEIDLIARETSQIVFVEVKSVTNLNYCKPYELFNYTKRQHLLRTINYITCRKNIKDWRLDLVCLTRDSQKVWIEHYKNVLAI